MYAILRDPNTHEELFRMELNIIVINYNLSEGLVKDIINRIRESAPHVPPQAYIDIEMPPHKPFYTIYLA